MKYDTQLTNLKSLLPQAQNILIVLPSQAGVDELAAGLALFLSLESASEQVPSSGSKSVVIATESVVRVSHTNLFGVGKVVDKISEGQGGNLSIVLEGVAAADGTVPTLEKLDWNTQGPNLNLVFHSMPGQRFEPKAITPKREGRSFDLIFVIGALNLDALGNLYQSKREIFGQGHLVNIDIQQQNLQFGTTNIVDPMASSVCEIVYQLLQSLGLPVDGDISTNILNGIYTMTSNLQGGNVSADTFEVVAAALKSGGQKPVSPAAIEAPTSSFDFGQFAQPLTSQPVSAQPFYVPTIPQSDPVQPFTPPSKEYQPEPQPSPEEAPNGEQAQTKTPEADWLTPKIFKGTNLG